MAQLRVDPPFRDKKKRFNTPTSSLGVFKGDCLKPFCVTFFLGNNHLWQNYSEKPHLASGQWVVKKIVLKVNKSEEAFHRQQIWWSPVEILFFLRSNNENSRNWKLSFFYWNYCDVIYFNFPSSFCILPTFKFFKRLSLITCQCACVSISTASQHLE